MLARFEIAAGHLSGTHKTTTIIAMEAPQSVLYGLSRFEVFEF
jgi:hypothetical protein